MSENQKPEEPMIIKSDRPHSVSMPEGTNVAVGKKGEAGSPAVRKVMADNENNVVENIVMDGGVSQSSDPSKDVMAKGEVNKVTKVKMKVQRISRVIKVQRMHPTALQLNPKTYSFHRLAKNQST